MNWSLTDGKLSLSTGVVDLGAPVVEVRELDGILIAVLDYRSYTDNNVYGVSLDGNVLWQIDANASLLPRPRNPVLGFVDVEGKPAIYFMEGFHAILDIKTGKYVFPDGQRAW